MAMALHDPEGGYYACRDPIGSGGDFITAPEISQIFGELLGLWCADLWQRWGRPNPVMLVELGPGRGALAQDLLRAAASVPGFSDALRLCFVEASPALRAEQRRRLGSMPASWVDRVEMAPRGPVFVIANEFVDALPVRQLVRGETEWAERRVALDPQGGFAFADGAESPIASALVPPGLRDCPRGTVVEIRPAAQALMAEIAERLVEAPGAALFIDYGSAASVPGATLRAVHRHRAADPLAEPGTADLSAHVDFAALAEAAARGGLEICGPVTQGRFLAALGAELRLARLCAGAGPEQRQALASGVARLLDPEQMGSLFKVMAAVSPGFPMPAGFSADFCAGAPSRVTAPSRQERG